MESDNEKLDWTSIVIYPEDTCYCRCGGVYRSHSKVQKGDDWESFYILTKKPCPKCKESINNCFRVSTDSHEEIIKGI